MKKNLHSADRIIRLLILVIAAALWFTGTLTGTLGIIVLVAGVILGATALINFCPIYAILGISTRPKS